jgi:hypothetical protein
MNLCMSWGKRLAYTLSLLGLCLPACVPGVLPEMPDMASGNGVDPLALDPKSIFEATAQPDLVQSCQGCHANPQGIVMPFLARGMEYASITGYGGGEFLTANPADSLLLQKGQHEGPALTSGQYNDINAWLCVEAATRTGLGMDSPATPSVAVGPGDFFISLEKLTGDPLSKITFTVALRNGGTTYDISNIQIIAGPFTGIHVKHPIFLFISRSGVEADPGDSLSDVEVILMPSTSVNLGAVLLPEVPRVARLAVAFQAIDKVNPAPANSISCKDFTLFNTTVRPLLASPCSMLCHGPSGTNTTYQATAAAAFDMSPAQSSDTNMSNLQLLCLETLSRVNLSTPTDSVLILQPTPAAQGGTTNHPFKLTEPTLLTAFTKAVTAWAAKEK